jgi:hypothetical protein
MTPGHFIIDAEKVVSRFGEWPHFHDMEVVSLHMERGGKNGPWLEFVVFVWAYTGRIAPSGCFEQTTHSLIRFRCDGVTVNQLEDFNYQNVLDGLHFSRNEDGESVSVDITANYGPTGALKCESVRVVEVIPATVDGLPPGA